MVSFKSNLNSISSTPESLTAIQSCLTTCFKHWRRKFVSLKQEERQETLHEEFYRHLREQRESHAKWYQQNYKDSRLLKKANENLRNLTLRFKEILTQNFRISRKETNRENIDSEKVEIVTKLLSSTLITAKTIAPFDCSTNATSIAAPLNTTVVEASRKMTITGDSFLLLREEYPDLDAEIRSILMARTQTGATIGEIKEDYRKNTGLRFPVYDNITDFLLCIPGVTAYCNERGTRIFNVRPNEKTKHIHDLVMQQKAPSERRGSNGYWKGRTQYGRDSDINSNVGLPSWRSSNFCRQADSGIRLSGSLISSSFHNQQQPQQFMPPTQSVDDNHSRNESEGFVDNRGGYYQDNCQYLFNRIYNGFENNKENVNVNVNGNSNSGYNNLNGNENQHAIIPYQTDKPNQIRDSQTNQNEEDLNLFKRPTGRAVRGSVTRASSPTGMSRSQTSDSIYSSDLDYEAHLLDFPLLGDDFLLYLARMELRCKFKKHYKVLQSGLCVSGQTIKAAAKRIRSLPYNVCGNKRIIVNIGSVDIMQGKPLVQIEHDFRNLINVINKRGFTPILTTLAPLANYSHDSSVKNKVERFNEFIKREGQFLLVVDIWASFVNERKQTLFDCYQNEPRQVTGAKESYVFWNKIGRQRVLQLIESNLEY